MVPKELGNPYRTLTLDERAGSAQGPLIATPPRRGVSGFSSDFGAIKLTAPTPGGQDPSERARRRHEADRLTLTRFL
jgi:hypothetical protein